MVRAWAKVGHDKPMPALVDWVGEELQREHDRVRRLALSLSPMDPLPSDPSLDMIRAGVEALQAFDPEKAEPEEVVCEIILRAFEIARSRRDRGPTAAAQLGQSEVLSATPDVIKRIAEMDDAVFAAVCEAFPSPFEVEFEDREAFEGC